MIFKFDRQEFEQNIFLFLLRDQVIDIHVYHLHLETLHLINKQFSSFSFLNDFLIF